VIDISVRPQKAFREPQQQRKAAGVIGATRDRSRLEAGRYEMRGRPLRPMVLALGVSGRRSLAVACDAALRLGLPRGVSGWRTGGGSLPEARASRARRRALSSAEGDAALAVEPAEEMGGGTLAFEGIAFEAGGNQVAVGVAPGADAGPWFVKRECKYFLSASNTRDYGASRRDSELPRLSPGPLRWVITVTSRWESSSRCPCHCSALGLNLRLKCGSRRKNRGDMGGMGSGSSAAWLLA